MMSASKDEGDIVCPRCGTELAVYWVPRDILTPPVMPRPNDRVMIFCRGCMYRPNIVPARYGYRNPVAAFEYDEISDENERDAKMQFAELVTQFSDWKIDEEFEALMKNPDAKARWHEILIRLKTGEIDLDDFQRFLRELEYGSEAME